MANASDFSWDLPDSSDDTATGGGGNALASILQSVSQLGTSAMIAFGPQNSGLATNPQGQLVRYPTTTTGTSMTTILMVGLLALVGVFVWTKL
jgi:hypothetical protein